MSRPGRRALIIAPQPFYADRGTPIAVRYVLQALNELGIEADLLTVPIGRDVSIPGATIHRVANPLGASSMPVGFSATKLFFDALLSWKMLFMLRQRRYDFIHAIEESVFPALTLRSRGSPPVIYDMASALPEHLAKKAAFRSRAVQSMLSRFEAWALQKSAVVICSAGLGDHVRSIAPDTPMLEWRFPARPPDRVDGEAEDLRRELGLADDARIIFYCGNFADYQGVDILFSAIPEVLRHNEDACFVCVGAASDDELQRGHAALQGVPDARYRLLPRQPREKIDRYLGIADVLVSPRSSLGNFPLKVFDFLAAGKPIVATDVPSHRCVLDDSMAMLCEPSAAGLAGGLSSVLADPVLADTLAAGATRFADAELAWPRFVQLIHRIYSTAERPA